MVFDLSMPILIVDIYNTMIRIISKLLKQIGFENVDDANDGSAALTKMRGKKYGLVIPTATREPMNGYELLKEIGGSPETSQTSFIMITAESKTENVIAAKKASVSIYIVKPFNAVTLKTKWKRSSRANHSGQCTAGATADSKLSIKQTDATVRGQVRPV